MARTKQTAARKSSQECAPISATDKLRMPLHVAATNGDVKMLKVLVKTRKFDIQRKDSYHRTPLHCAAIHGHLEVVKLLLAHNASVKAVNNKSFTALTFAVTHGRLEIFNLLVENGASVFNVCSEGRTLLHYAAKYGYVEMAKTLLGNRVSTTVQDKERRTALDFAVYYQQWDIVRLLLEAGHYRWLSCQPQTQDDGIRRATTIDDEAVISALKRETETYPRNAVEAAALLGKEDWICRFLNEHGCHPQGSKEQRTSPVYVAVENGHHACVEMLVNHGADVNDPWAHRTVLECALQHRRATIAGTLLRAGASLAFYNGEAQNSENTTVALLALQGPRAAAGLLSYIPSIKALSMWLIAIANSKHVSILQEYFCAVAPNIKKKYDAEYAPTPIARLVRRLIQSRSTVVDSPRAQTRPRAIHSDDIRTALVAALDYDFVGVFFLVCAVEPEILSEVQTRSRDICDRARRLLPSHINAETDKKLITCLSKAGYTLPLPLL